MLDFPEWLCYTVLKSSNRGVAARKGSEWMATTSQKNIVSSNASAANSGTIGESDIWNILVEVLAKVRSESYSDLNSQFASDNDMKTDSSEAEVLIVELQERLECKLPNPSSLRAEQFSSVKSLANIAMQSISGQTDTLSSATKLKPTVQSIKTTR